MKTGSWIAIVALLAWICVSPASSQAQESPKKGEVEKVPPTPTAPPPPYPTPGAPGGGGAEVDSTYPDISAQLSAAEQRMSTLAAEAMKLSQSFRELATLHEGADRSEILMMQRMSDAMGSVAGELGLSFKQYQKMVADESTDQSGTMREQVQVLKTVLDAMAGQVDSGVKTLHSLQAQLGQG